MDPDPLGYIKARRTKTHADCRSGSGVAAPLKVELLYFCFDNKYSLRYVGMCNSIFEKLGITFMYYFSIFFNSFSL